MIWEPSSQILPKDGLTQHGFSSSASPFQSPILFFTWVASNFAFSKLAVPVPPGSFSLKCQKSNWRVHEVN